MPLFPNIKVYEVRGDGKYRVRRVRTDPKYPKRLIDDKGRHAFTIMDSSVFAEIPAQRCNTLEEFIGNPPAPPSPDYKPHLRMFAAENGAFGYTPEPIPWEQRCLERERALQQGASAAEQRIAQQRSSEASQSILAIAMATGVGLFGLIIVMIALKDVIG